MSLNLLIFIWWKELNFSFFSFFSFFDLSCLDGWFASEFFSLFLLSIKNGLNLKKSLAFRVDNLSYLFLRLWLRCWVLPNREGFFFYFYKKSSKFLEFSSKRPLKRWLVLVFPKAAPIYLQILPRAMESVLFSSFNSASTLPKFEHVPSFDYS